MFLLFLQPMYIHMYDTYQTEKFDKCHSQIQWASRLVYFCTYTKYYVVTYYPQSFIALSPFTFIYAPLPILNVVQKPRRYTFQ